MISFVVPAHNEEALIGRTLAAINEAAGSVGEEYEIVVADDASTDRTVEIAQSHGARVTAVNRRQIAAARNVGAQATRGDLLIFVDADTSVTLPALARALRNMARGAIGGGCCVRFDGPVPFYGMVLERLLRLGAPYVGLAGGCFLFCTRAAYLSAGGFDEQMYWGEEVAFASQLKRQGRFVVLHECVITSGRKLRVHSALDLIWLGARLAIDGGRFRERVGLEFWYGPRQNESDCQRVQAR